MLAQAIPSEAIGKMGVVLIDHPVITIHMDRIEVSSAEGTGLFIPNAVKSNYGRGIVDPETGLVVKGTGSQEQTRWFYRTNEDRVVPPGRYAYAIFRDRRVVVAGGRPQVASGVVLTSLTQARAGSNSSSTSTVSIGTAKLQQLLRSARNAEQFLPDVSGHARNAMENLIRDARSMNEK